MVSESTRNGMSSTTTSTTVWPLADQPCSARVGVNDPHVRGALRAVGGELVVRRERAVHVDVAAVDEVLGGDVAVVGADQLGDLVVGRPAGALAGLRQLDRLVDQLGLLDVGRR